MAAATGEGVGIGSVTLRKRLHERALLLSTEMDKNKLRLTVRRTIAAQRRNVLHVQNLLNIPEVSESAPEREKNKPEQPFTNGHAEKSAAAFANGANGAAHKKCASEKQCATDDGEQPYVFKDEKGYPVHMAHKAHKTRHIDTRDTGMEVF